AVSALPDRRRQRFGSSLLSYRPVWPRIHSENQSRGSKTSRLSHQYRLEQQCACCRLFRSFRLADRTSNEPPPNLNGVLDLCATQIRCHRIERGSTSRRS